MYFKLDESLAHSSLNFVLELAMQLWIQVYLYYMNEMHVLFDWQICAGYEIIYTNYKYLSVMGVKFNRT